MNRPAHWAFSPLDLQAHLLLAEGCHPTGVLKSRCGHLLPLRVMRSRSSPHASARTAISLCLSEAILALCRENPVRKDVS